MGTEKKSRRCEPDNIEKLSDCLINAVAGTKRNIEIEYVDANGNEINPSIGVIIPVSYSLLRYSNDVKSL